MDPFNRERKTEHTNGFLSKRIIFRKFPAYTPESFAWKAIENHHNTFVKMIETVTYLSDGPNPDLHISVADG